MTEGEKLRAAIEALRRRLQHFPDGLKVTLDLEFLRPTTIIEIANDLLRASQSEGRPATELKNAHCRVLEYLSKCHGDEWLEDVNS